MTKNNSRFDVEFRQPSTLPALCLWVSLASLLMAPVLLWSGSAAAQIDISCELSENPDPEECLVLLGKHFFFDERLSTPRRRQACVSCHDPAIGWVLPDSKINQTSVVAPGASPQARGFIKSPSNAYAPRDAFTGSSDGNFWDGRAEGCAEVNCQIGDFAAETITPEDVGGLHTEFLGPVADQALNPTSRPGVEQNTRVQVVCNLIRNGSYADLYEGAWGEPINCSPQPKGNPAYDQSFKKVAVGASAWQASRDVNSFTSKKEADLTVDEKLGRDLFRGKAGCIRCHSGNTFSDHRFRNIGIPFNREIPTTEKGDIVGLSGHLGDGSPPGLFKTAILLNVAKGEGDINGLLKKSNKAFMHNGYLKSLRQVVHFYNTSRARPVCDGDATAEEAIANDCWPEPEFPGSPRPPSSIVGDLGLTEGEEELIVLYLRTLSDSHTPSAPVATNGKSCPPGQAKKGNC